MDTIIKADIFFFITTIAVVIFVILGSIALIYLIGILRDVKRATRTISLKIDEATEEIALLQRKVAESALFNFIFGKKKTRK